MNILAIESSCDETAAAVVRDGRTVLSDAIASQADMHALYGGVVPEIASRKHIEAISGLADQALQQAGVTRADIDAVAVTYAPGLIGALLVGVNFAKSAAFGLGVPIVPVHHVRGHIAANYIDSDLEPPYVCLLASGGHTAVLEVRGYRDLHSLGQSRDDAAGEAFDKAARVLGLPYPGGPEIEKLAREGKPSLAMPRPVFKRDDAIWLSYSGLKTFVVNLVHNYEQRGEDIPRADIAASFQSAAVEQLVDAAETALARTGLDTVAVAGGVSTNAYLRARIKEKGEANGWKVRYPSLRYCTDNAAMIGAAAYFEIAGGAAPASLTLDAAATVPLS